MSLFGIEETRSAYALALLGSMFLIAMCAGAGGVDPGEEEYWLEAYAGEDMVIDEGQTAEFDGSGSTSDPYAIVTYAWVFGDGSDVGYGVEVEHDYLPDEGEYLVYLLVSDEMGHMDDDTMTVTVENVAPIVEAGPDQDIPEGGYGIFQGSFTDPGIYDTHTIEWDFGDGTGSEGNLYTYHRYVEEGTYTVTLTVTDDDGGVGSDTLTVTVTNRPPYVGLYYYEMVQSPYGYFYYYYYDEPVVDEGETFQIYGYYYDQGMDDLAIELDYGDGTSESWTDDYYGWFLGTHSYDDDGFYTITLTAEDEDGAVGTDTIDVEVQNVPPVVDIGDDLMLVDEGEVIEFSASLYDPSGSDTFEISWDFGDGSTASGSLDPTHAFADNGVYTVTLTVEDDDGGVGVDETTVAVHSVPPETWFDPIEPAEEGSSVAITAWFEDPGTADTFTLLWDLGDGTVITSTEYTTDEEDPSLHGASICHAYPDDGIYPLTLTVVDDDGEHCMAAAEVAVENAPPAVEAGEDITTQEGWYVQFHGSFVDPGSGDTHTIQWDFGDGAYGSGYLTPWHAYREEGTYTVTLTVTDDDGGAGSDTMEVFVENGAPYAYIYSLQGYYGPVVIVEGETVQFYVYYYDYGWHDTLSITLDYGDGTVESWTDDYNGYFLKEHTFEDDGVFTVELTVSDDDGGVTVASLTVEVENAPPVIDDGNYEACEGEEIQFSASVNDPGNDKLTYEWDFGDGGTASGTLTPTHAYGDNGVYTVTLTVTDDDGDSDIATWTATIDNVAPAVDAGYYYMGTVGEDIAFVGTFDDPGWLDTHSFEWDFGDGTTGSGTLTPTHAYSEAGYYYVTLAVTDDDGGVGTDLVYVYIRSSLVYAYVYYDQTVDEGDLVRMYAYGYDLTYEGGLEFDLDLGDGTTMSWSTTTYYGWKAIDHTYFDSGIYTVTLTVTASSGESAVDTMTVTVLNVVPVVDAGEPFASTDEMHCVHFSATVTDPGDDEFDIVWDFGDGTTASGTLTTSHQWRDNGVFTVTITVTDDDGASASDSVLVAVVNNDPTVWAYWDTTVDEGDEVWFQATAYDPGADDTFIFHWDFGDGTTLTTSDYTPVYDWYGLSKPSHTYVDDGVYTVTVTVMDDDGGWDTATVTVTVENVAPVVDAGEDITTYEGYYAVFYGEVSDPGDDTFTYEWDFGDGSTYMGSLYTYHQYMETGTYTVTLTVTDHDGGVGTDTLTVTIENRAPYVYLYYPQVYGNDVSFYLYYYDYGAEELDVELDLGDGTVDAWTDDDYYHWEQYYHTYAEYGEYTITLTVTDEEGATGTATLTVTIEGGE